MKLLLAQRASTVFQFPLTLLLHVCTHQMLFCSLHYFFLDHLWTCLLCVFHRLLHDSKPGPPATSWSSLGLYVNSVCRHFHPPLFPTQQYQSQHYCMLTTDLWAFQEQDFLCISQKKRLYCYIKSGKNNTLPWETII